MLSAQVLPVAGKSLMGVRIDLPLAPILMLQGQKGIVGCGYFKVEAADKFGHALAVVSGVASFDELLNGEVSALSAAAAGLGVKTGMTGAEAAAILA